MTGRVRKFALTAHVTASVGWLGAVGCFLALAVVGVTSSDDGLARACYLVMTPIGWFVLVPLSIASLVSGVVQALGTPWGLVRHYWVLAKLVITPFATLLLLLHMNPIGLLAEGGDDRLRVQVLVQAAAALVALLVATGLSVFKPRGRTGFRRRAGTSPTAGQSPAAG